MQAVPMNASHISSLAALEQMCFSTPWSEQSLREELDNPHAVFRVITDEDGNVLGYGGFHRAADEGYIDNIAVFPAARRQGVAAAILASFKQYAAEQELIRLTLEVRASNAPAIALYETAGFIRDGVRPGYYRHPTEDAIIYSAYFDRRG